MSEIICPNEGWVFKYQDYEGREPQYQKKLYRRDDKGQIITPMTLLAGIDDSEGEVVFDSDCIDEEYEAYVYQINEDGISLTTENKLIQTIKATSPPTFFDIFEVYMEDCNGVTATYGLKDMEIGKSNAIDLSALVRGEDFNDAYVVKIGYHFKKAKGERKFKLRISEMSLVFMLHPLYCEPQEVAEFLSLVDNKGQPLMISDVSNPSYNTLAKRIIEAEDFVEATTRQAFTERRIEREIRNAEQAWPGGLYGYFGIMSANGTNDIGAQSFFKGVPVKLNRDNIHAIDYSKGDLVEVRRYGSHWTVVPEDCIWSDEAKGILFIRSMFFQKDSAVRVTYRYGKGPIPPDLKQAVIMKTALLYMQTDFLRAGFPQSPEFFAMRDNAMQSWTWALRDLLRPYTNTVCVGGV